MPVQAARRKTSRRLSHFGIWFQLVKIWVATPNRVTGHLATTRFVSVVRTNRSIASRVRSVHRGRLGDFNSMASGHRARIGRPELLSW